MAIIERTYTPQYPNGIEQVIIKVVNARPIEAKILCGEHSSRFDISPADKIAAELAESLAEEGLGNERHLDGDKVIVRFGASGLKSVQKMAEVIAKSELAVPSFAEEIGEWAEGMRSRVRKAREDSKAWNR